MVASTFPNPASFTHRGIRSLAPFDAKNLRKLHIQLHHGSKRQIINRIKYSRRWYSNLDSCMDALLEYCQCKIANNLYLHPVVSSRPPPDRKQTHVSIDIVFIEGVPCFHVICKAASWTETNALPNSSITQILNIFKRIQVLRHGAKQTINLTKLILRTI